jgi:CCR4-NOT transcriptional regulation complex NOT5 subunit
MRKSNQRIFLVVTLAAALSCSSMHGQLREIAQSPSDIAVIKDAKGGYWAFPGSALKLLDKNRIRLTGDQRIAYCAVGSGPGDKLAQELMRLRNTASYSGGFGPRSVSSSGATTTTTSSDGKTVTTKEDPYSLDQCTVGTPKEPADIEVIEILYRGKDQSN